MTDTADRGHPPGLGHRLVPHTADVIVEAWGPSKVSCVTEALSALVEEFAEVPEPVTASVLPLAAEPDSAEGALIALFEEVLYALDVFSVVPVRFHLFETEEGGLAGDMEVVSLDHVEVVGPEPKGVSYHGVALAPDAQGWWCHVLIDV